MNKLQKAILKLSGLEINEIVYCQGETHIQLFDKDGKLKSEERKKNTVTNLGKRMICDQLVAGPAVAKAAWMELGTGNQATPATATVLGAYLSGSRKAVGTGADAITTRLSSSPYNTVTYTCTFTGLSGVIIEAGLFNVVTQNTTDLCFYQTCNQTIGTSDTLAITWIFTLS